METLDDLTNIYKPIQAEKKTLRYIYISLFTYLETGSYYTILAGLESRLPASIFQVLKYQSCATTATWKLHFKNVITTLVLLACSMSI